jgi:putative GTP pyrophosphokinase
MPDKLKPSLVERSVKFEAAAEILGVHLRHVLRRTKLVAPEVVPTRISNRVKSIKSIFRKIAKKKREGLQLNTARRVENHINDFAGARLVCDYLTDIVFIHAYLQAHPAFKVLPKKTEDYIERPKDGYRGVHLVVEVQTSFGRAKCEIQLRTTLQHAWAEKAHDLLYKLKKKELRLVPKEIRLLMEEQSDLLYNIDKMAVEIAGAIRKSQSKGGKR